MTKQEYKNWELMKQELEEQERILDVQKQEYYQKLGQQYYIIAGENYDSSLEEIMSKLKKNQEQLLELEIKIDEVEQKLQEPVDNICPRCGKVMEASAKFCSECGARLGEENISGHVEVIQESLCKSCGSILKPNAKFCGKCGTPV